MAPKRPSGQEPTSGDTASSQPSRIAAAAASTAAAATPSHGAGCAPARYPMIDRSSKPSSTNSVDSAGR